MGRSIKVTTKEVYAILDYQVSPYLLSVKNIAELFECSRMTITRRLAQLKREGYIERIGKQWRVIK